jgi:hypothetical protein
MAEARGRKLAASQTPAQRTANLAKARAAPRDSWPSKVNQIKVTKSTTTVSKGPRAGQQTDSTFYSAVGTDASGKRVSLRITAAQAERLSKSGVKMTFP